MKHLLNSVVIGSKRRRSGELHGASPGTSMNFWLTIQRVAIRTRPARAEMAAVGQYGATTHCWIEVKE